MAKPNNEAHVVRVDRAAAFREALGHKHIDLKLIRALAFNGIPEEDKSLRSTVWKLLLNYLPLERNTWDQTLKRKRSEYEEFCNELIVDPKTLGGPTPPPLARSAHAAFNNDDSDDDDSDDAAAAALQRLSVSADDHPLSTGSQSKWQMFFFDKEVREQIDRDVQRTHPDLNFFSSNTAESEKHRESMKRALFIFAKLNPGLKYVQGMNELFAPIYYAFANDPNLGNADQAEADTFFCFMDLMSEFRDHFCQQLDNSEVGIRATMSRLSASLKAFDPALYQHMEVTNRIDPQFYAFRWVTTLLTQEFSFPDVVRVWDSMLSDSEGRMNCLLRFCVAMLLNVREELIKGDFASNMKVLQHYPPVDVQVVLRQADALRKFKSVLILD